MEAKNFVVAIEYELYLMWGKIKWDTFVVCCVVAYKQTLIFMGKETGFFLFGEGGGGGCSLCIYLSLMCIWMVVTMEMLGSYRAYIRYMFIYTCILFLLLMQLGEILINALKINPLVYNWNTILNSKVPKVMMCEGSHCLSQIRRCDWHKSSAGGSNTLLPLKCHVLRFRGESTSFIWLHKVAIRIISGICGWHNQRLSINRERERDDWRNVICPSLELIFTL